jgi:vacuolar-type H+-ATPase subunit I/STV1
MSKHTGDGDNHQHGAPINEVNLQQPTPLFERLVTEEVQELKAYVRIVESQNRRLIELERAHGDLESRLEIESKSRQQLEATLEAREREWAEKLDHVESDRDQWKRLVEVEKVKNSKLIDQVVRKDQDIHRMLQRKVRDVPGQICFCVCV